MNNRRKLLVALGAGALATPLACFAQQHNRVYRLGILATNTRTTPGFLVFQHALRELGYSEGKNLVIEARFADGQFDRLPGLAADLLQKNLDVIYATNTPAVEAVKPLAGATPIVFSAAADPVGSGFVKSLAKPGGNITGITIMSPELSAKRLQILKEAFPNISRTAVFVSEEPNLSRQTAEIQRAAKFLKIEVMSTQLASRDRIETTIALLRKWRADSMYFVESPTHNFNRNLLAEFAAKIRLPAIWGSVAYAESGGLISYGANSEALSRRAASYVDKILKGAKPAELPVEQPTTFDLVINMKTAKALGIKFPQSILLRADKVIE
jgi:putative ABC transport system substrate-binding protein